jgi:hypothetical protein
MRPSSLSLDDVDTACEQIERFAREVMPEFS